MAISESISSSSWLKKLKPLLLLLVLITIANSAVHLVQVFSGDKVVDISAAKTTKQSSIPSLSPQAIAEMHLFGRSGVSAESADAQAPQTSGNLVLKGVVVKNDSKESGAFISEHDQDEVFYKIDDALPGNATLAAVFTDHVLINRSGAMETLSFPQDPSSISTNAKSGTDDYAKFVTLPPEPGTSLTKMTDAEIANSYKAKFKSNPQVTLSEIGIQPVAIGKAEGYKITGDGLSAKFSGAGLKKDDVILSVNGQKLGDLDKDKSLVDTISLDKKPSMEIKRGDNIFVITYSPK